LPRAVRGSFPSAFTSLMTVTIVAFAMGLVVSPLGRAPASRGAPTAPLAQARAATIQPLPAIPPTAPLIVPTTLPPIAAHSTSPLPRAKSSPSRASRDGVSHERVQTVARKHGPGSKMWTAASVRASAASARAAADANSEGDDGDRPSRKSLEKESVDLTKQGADSLARKSAAKPWVDPWAD
jgi:hypothetical protein